MVRDHYERKVTGMKEAKSKRLAKGKQETKKHMDALERNLKKLREARSAHTDARSELIAEYKALASGQEARLSSILARAIQFQVQFFRDAGKASVTLEACVGGLLSHQPEGKKERKSSDESEDAMPYRAPAVSVISGTNDSVDRSSSSLSAAGVVAEEVVRTSTSVDLAPSLPIPPSVDPSSTTEPLVPSDDDLHTVDPHVDDVFDPFGVESEGDTNHSTDDATISITPPPAAAAAAFDPFGDAQSAADAPPTPVSLRHDPFEASVASSSAVGGSGGGDSAGTVQVPAHSPPAIPFDPWADD